LGYKDNIRYNASSQKKDKQQNKKRSFRWKNYF
jgi:hypothetical protein